MEIQTGETTQMRSKILTIADSRWWTADIEPFNCCKEDKPTQPDYEDTSLECDNLRCTVCAVTVGEDRSALIAHHRSDWHKNNLKRVLRKKSVLSEEEFEQKISDEDDQSEEQSSSEEEEECFSLESSRCFFTQNGEVFSIYRNILHDDLQPSKYFFSRPLDCAIFLLAGGHFSGGIFKDENLVVHKSFHRYTVRAKQGGSQSVADARQKKIKSAGASLRRYNEKALKEEIQGLIEAWKDALRITPLIFIRSSTFHRSIFVSDSFQSSPFLRSDDRLRTIPFITHRPSLEELQRTWQRLRTVFVHGKIEEFRQELAEKDALRKRKNVLIRRRLEGFKGANLCNSSSDEETAVKTKLLDAPSSITLDIKGRGRKDDLRKEEEIDKFTEVTKEEREKIYAAVRLNSRAELQCFLKTSGDKYGCLKEYIINSRFPPDSSSFLHVAARNDSRDVLLELLSLGCDPTAKNDKGLVPYQVSQTRAMRQSFSRFRMENPSSFDWDKGQVPMLAVVSEEKLAKEAEKKRQHRERRRIREKLKKEEEKAEKLREEARKAFLTLSDREKRALAAERRLAESLKEKCTVDEDRASRCFQCGKIIIGTPFEYNDNFLCSIGCVHEHRRLNPPGSSL